MNLITKILIGVAGIFILIVIFALVSAAFMSSINDTSYIGAGEDAADSMYDEISCGLVLVSKDKDKVCVVQANSGPFGFPKGHVDKLPNGEMETYQQAAKRETMEEIGVDAPEDSIQSDELRMTYIFDVTPEMLAKHLAKMEKLGQKPHVTKAGPSNRLLVFFVAYVEPKDFAIQETEVKGAKWVSWDEAEELMKGTDEIPKSNQITILELARKKVFSE